MLIHGRLLVTQNNLMLDEVRSLLQKSLRRCDHDLIQQATKELIGREKDQLPWKSIVTFIFEDHCLNDVRVFEALLKLYRQGNKFGCIEVISKSFTCRYAACLQVVALEKDNINADTWIKDIPLTPELTGLVSQDPGGIDIDLLLVHIVKYWQEKNTDMLTSLFMLVNMAAKVEKRYLTKKGKAYLLDTSIKKPSLYHLVMTVLYRHTTDEYMKAMVRVCFKFSVIADVPEGLIMFAVLSQLMHVDQIRQRSDDTDRIVKTGEIQWTAVGKLQSMPSWAVDKHTFRGKFGKQSRHIFEKKFKGHGLSEAQVHEFHGERPKSDIKMFFDVACICNNDILPENPIWEETQAIYLKHKPSLQKCAKMTASLYKELKHQKAIVFKGGRSSDEEKSAAACLPMKRKASAQTTADVDANAGKRKKMKLSEKASSSAEACSTSETAGPANTCPRGPLLQLPTGAGKVYTRLDRRTNKVWKGPYHSQARQNLCVFYHRAMKEVFFDKHTLPIQECYPYIVFPLVKSKSATVKVHRKEFYDCIAKKQVPESEGEFIDRASLGLVQLHKIPDQIVAKLPVSVWAHFAFRYLLNIGDTGLYNAIATDDLIQIYGIDMEENRGSVKGNDIMNMLFGKLPKKSIAAQVELAICRQVEEFSALVLREFDMEKLSGLYRKLGVENNVSRCAARLVRLKKALDQKCKDDIGI